MKQELTVIEPIKNLIKKEQTGFGLNIQIQNPFKIVPFFEFLFNDIHNIKDSFTILTNFEYQILREKICGAFHWFGYGCSCCLQKDQEIIFACSVGSRSVSDSASVFPVGWIRSILTRIPNFFLQPSRRRSLQPISC